MEFPGEGCRLRCAAALRRRSFLAIFRLTNLPEIAADNGLIRAVEGGRRLSKGEEGVTSVREQAFR
jgi:hypothetical protein